MGQEANYLFNQSSLQKYYNINRYRLVNLRFKFFYKKTIFKYNKKNQNNYKCFSSNKFFWKTIHGTSYR